MRRPWSPSGVLRTRVALVLLVIGATLALVAATEKLFTTPRNEEVASRVLRQYSAFVAWAYANAMEESMRGMAREALGAVNHGDALHMSPRVPQARELAHYLPFDERCGCHRPVMGPSPETFFAFEISASALDVAVNTHEIPSEGWEVDRPLAMPVPSGVFTGYSARDRDTVMRLVKKVARDMPDRENGFTYVIAPLQDSPRVIAYTLMPTVRGDTIVYGAQYRASMLSATLSELLDERDLLPEPFRAGRRNRDLVEIAVVDASKHTLFASGDPARSRYSATAHLSPRFGSLAVLASVKPDQAAGLVVGGLPRSRMPFLIGMLVLSAALTIVAIVQLRREGELARVRAGWVASVSHELRTPLAQIRLYVDTIRLGRTDTPERRDWALAQVDRETTRLGHLVEKVLSFSRFGRTAHETLRADRATDVIPRIVEEFRALAEARNVRIETAIEDVPAVALRRDGLRHVLLNLLENAVKYGPAGQTVRVELTRAGNEMRLSVSDQGPGVARDERDAVWRPFTRGRGADEQGGSGIGLAIVREVAQEAGGRAWVEDAAGGGARFVVAVPFAAGVEASS